MIDLELLRTNFKHVKETILKKDPSFEIETLRSLDEQTRVLRVEVEGLRQEKNDLARQASKGISDEVRARSIEIGKKLKELEVKLEEQESAFKSLLLSCPNMLKDDVQSGNKESNKAVKVHGSKPAFNFKPKNHLELNEKLKWLDFDAAAKMSGGQFVLYKEPAAKLMYALIQLMIRTNAKHGFSPTIPPYLVSTRSLINSSNLPKFAEDVYKLAHDDLYTIPTAEVPLTNIYANHIFAHDELPVRMCAWTSCFRREAGGYGAHERGLIRIHQFEKVELYTLCTPENSEEEQKRMLACAEEILQKLELHYQVSLLAAQDCSFASAKTYDIEVWLPGQKSYYEVSSVSNCTDFQSRRAQIRYRAQSESKPSLVHTLNASSLALPRLMVALLETYQTHDGSIELPAALQQAVDAQW
jgi:seryl-tRNA synthetase